MKVLTNQATNSEVNSVMRAPRYDKCECGHSANLHFGTEPRPCSKCDCKDFYWNQDGENERLDVRDFERGETYYAIADKERGGRCVMNGMFVAAWRTKAEASAEANKCCDHDRQHLTVVKCLKP